MRNGDTLTFGFVARTKKEGSRWAPILTGWNKAIVRYCEIWNGRDVPYHLNERANISLFASGAVLSGATILEEFRCTKGRKQASISGGRVDLYISTRDWDAEIEAKQVFINGISNEDRITGRASRALEQAHKAVISADRDHFDRYACAFLPIWIPTNRCPSYKAKHKIILGKLQDKVASVSAIDVCGWCFPFSVRNFKDTEKDGTSSYYPGVFVIMQKVP